MSAFDGELVGTFTVNLDFYKPIRVCRNGIWQEATAASIEVGDVFETTIERGAERFKTYSIEKGDDKQSVDVNVAPMELNNE